MKSPLRTLLCRGPFARRMSPAVAARPTSGLTLATAYRRPGPSLLASSLMAVPTVATGPAVTSSPVAALPEPSASPEPPAAPVPLPARPRRSRWPGRAFRPRRLAGPGRSVPAVDMDLAAEFIQLHRREVPGAGPAGPRLKEIRREIRLTGTYQHTLEELEFGARVAWRNSGRCIGRLYWKSLKVRDRREVSSAADIAAECADHLRAATNHGRVRPVITVFAPDAPARSGPRIWNEQLVRY